jgi:class 3 adenylate cyclase
VGDDREPMEPSPRRGDTIRKRASRTDSKPRLVATARFIRELLPGDEAGEAPSAGGSAVSQRIGRLVSELQPERPSALRELGLGALQAWQALSEAQGRGRGKVDVAILFTDLVGFSSWALHAGDEAALELLRRVATAEDGAISAHSGTLVKRLGDGAMAVFRDASQAISAALEAQR